MGGNIVQGGPGVKLWDHPSHWGLCAVPSKLAVVLNGSYCPAAAASAVRASNAEVDDARALAGALNNMGMMLYGMMPPTGYSMKADVWVNSSALLGRMNFALALASGKIKGVKVDPASLTGSDSSAAASAGTPDPQQTLARLEDSLLAGDISKPTHDTISKQLEDPKISQRMLDDPKRPPNVAAITGLILGSPEFQRR